MNPIEKVLAWFNRLPTYQKVALGAGILLTANSALAGGRGGFMSAGSGNVAVIGQGDPRWAKRTVGNSSRTMEDVGCVLTAMTCAINKLTGKSLNPVDVNEAAKQGGAFGPGSASVVTGTVAKLLGCVKPAGFVATTLGTRDVPRQVALIDDTLKKGGLALIRVEYSATEISGDHTIVCFRHDGLGFTCMDPAGAGKIIVLDQLLTTQRTKTKKYFGVGVAPIFRA